VKAGKAMKLHHLILAMVVGTSCSVFGMDRLPKKFQELKMGMTEAEVKQILGEPNSVSKGDSLLFREKANHRTIYSYNSDGNGAISFFDGKVEGWDEYGRLLDKLMKKDRESKEQQRIQAQEKEKTDIARNPLRKTFDKVEGMTWYEDRGLSNVSAKEAYKREAEDLKTYLDALTETGQKNGGLKYASQVYTYMGQSAKTGDSWIRLVIKYVGPNWLFVNHYKFVVDGTSYELSSGTSDEVVRKTQPGGVSEVLDIRLPDKYLPMVEAIANSKETILRFYGKDEIGDHTVTKAEKLAMRHILDFSKTLQFTRKKTDK